MPEDVFDDSYGGMGYWFQLQNLYSEIEQEIDELRQHEYDAAQFESNYRMLVSIETAKERMHGTPVTVIDGLIKGYEPIAKAKLEWKKAEADAKTSINLIFLKKDKAEMLKEIIKHEWYRPSNA